jgi:hypothetical protein
MTDSPAVGAAQVYMAEVLIVLRRDSSPRALLPERRSPGGVIRRGRRPKWPTPLSQMGHDSAPSAA